MSVAGDGPADAPSRLYLRQLLVGREFATRDRFGRQMANYVYAIGDTERGEAVLVDPAYAPEELLGLLEADGMTCVGAFLTHYHADHAGGTIAGHEIAGVGALLDRVDVPVHVQRAELDWLVASTGLDASAFVTHDPGEVVAVGDVPVTALLTPGHTPGSQCLLVDGALVTGDTLFLDGCGRTDLPGGDADALYDSLFNRLAPLGAQTRVLVGHAYARPAEATLGELRRNNPVLSPATREEWLARYAR